MAKDRLEVTLRRRRDDKVFKSRTVWADHRDEDQVHDYLVAMARDLDNAKGDAGEFAEGYELEVRGVDRRWIDFRLPGRKG
ncbi:hypothetical protein [Kribbella catacumbae]|uniref:hypothetical protein n=1 Tax=Kribbella catacumbae TaxID=460086 RepID=UPI0003628DEC|nr:hypothetical protein [Kribbella catacumbae]